jgi:hypothetical protein
VSLTSSQAKKGAVDAAPRLWTEEEFAAFRTSMAAMLDEARKMGLSHWELRRVDDPAAETSAD